MLQTLDIRMARAAKAEARALRDPTQALHRSLLRGRAALRPLLREGSAPPDADRAFDGALQLGDAAAVELVSIPDTPDLRARRTRQRSLAIMPGWRRRSRRSCCAWYGNTVTAMSSTLPMLRRPNCWLLASRAQSNGRGHLPAPQLLRRRGR
jgi:hypothetical protein